MRHQRVLNELSIFRLTLRKMGLLYFVPHIFLYVLIPLLGIGYLLYHGDGANARGLIFYDFQKFIPFLSVWWILFGLDDYVEGDSSEILHVHKRSLLAEFWLMFSWYILHVAVLFLAFGIFLENYWRDYPLIVTQALAFASVAFFPPYASLRNLWDAFQLWSAGMGESFFSTKNGKLFGFFDSLFHRICLFLCCPISR